MSSAGNFDGNLDTLRGGTEQLALLSYNFQVNASSGSLFVVFKNYSDLPTIVSTVSYDGVSVPSPSVALSNGCQAVYPGDECEVTLTMNASTAHLPAENSQHTLGVFIGQGQELQFPVTAGTLAEAACTFTSSC